MWQIIWFTDVVISTFSWSNISWFLLKKPNYLDIGPCSHLLITISILPECFCFLVIKRSNGIKTQIWTNETTRNTTKTAGNLTAGVVEFVRGKKKSMVRLTCTLNLVSDAFACSQQTWEWTTRPSWSFPLHLGWPPPPDLPRTFLV